MFFFYVYKFLLLILVIKYNLTLSNKRLLKGRGFFENIRPALLAKAKVTGKPKSRQHNC